jgi:hypothetical protein
MSPAHSTPPEGRPTAAEHFCDDDHQHEMAALPAQIAADGDAKFTVRVP